MNSPPTPLGEAVMGRRGEEGKRRGGERGMGGFAPELSTFNLTNFQLPLFNIF
jgi:hypothetical protein